MTSCRRRLRARPVKSDRLFRAALRAAPSAVDAEDAVAAAFLELWRRRSQVHLVDGSVLPWLLTTTHNITRNLVRHQRRYRAFLRRLPADSAARSAEEITVEAADVLMHQQQLAAVLARLPAADAAILTLVGLDELSPSEAAQALGISAEAARQRLSRARRRAREAGVHITDAIGEPSALWGGEVR
ncbi:sigma-70 family RNA polymerase sigma factor [Salinibacterium sp. ZJ450]|uniref:RNA polymerase sigma factor n=1 Tax=Salinibacterium sp. ZJ450 TaxID=2708338 RepID=UPI001CD7F69F